MFEASSDETRELAAATGQHQMLGDLGGETAGREPVTHQVEDLLDARPDHAGELGLGDLIDVPLSNTAHARVGDDLALVGERREGAAVQGLQPFGMLHRRTECARYIDGHAVAAERDRIGVQEVSVGDNRQGGCAGAEVDAGHAELRLVRGDDRQRAGIGRGHKTRHAKMAALDAEHQISGRGFVRGDGVQIDRQAFTAHAAGLGDAAVVVEAKIRGQSVKSRSG